MKVLSITPSFHPSSGGIENLVFDLARHVKRLGVQMDVAHVATGLQRAEEELDGVAVHRVPLYGHRVVGWAPALRQLARRYDLLHVHDPQLLAITANVRYTCGRKPAVLSTHGGFWHTNRYSGLKRLAERVVLRGAAGHYRRVLASSAGDLAYFGQFVDRIALCNNGVRVENFSAITTDRQRNAYRWICWGRISHNKRLDLVIDYAAQARRRGFPIDLLICGQDSEGLMAGLEQKIAQLGLAKAIHLGEFMSDTMLRKELLERGVFITASEHEGFGLSVVEALAAGLVVLCRDMLPLNTFVSAGSCGGFLRFDNSSSDLQALTDFLVQSPKRIGAMAAAARTSASAYDWQFAAPRFVSHYRDVLSRGAASREFATNF